MKLDGPKKWVSFQKGTKVKGPQKYSPSPKIDAF